MKNDLEYSLSIADKVLISQIEKWFLFGSVFVNIVNIWLNKFAFYCSYYLKLI